MALASNGFSISGVNTSATVLLNLKASSTNPLRLLEVGIWYTVLSTNPYDFGIVRMNAVGTGTITSTAGATHETGGTSPSVLETAWVTTRPTVTGQYFRRGSLPLTLGAGLIWPITGGIFVPVSGGICLQGINASGATTGTIEGYMTWDE